jgi:WhiB family redox-sensing transcriptional regulator
VRVVSDEDETYQSPTLGADELAWAEPSLASQAVHRWVMAGPDPHTLPTLESLLGRPLWHRRAACSGLGTEGFVIDKGHRFSRGVCQDCPVCQECLKTALADPELVGLWGGTTDRERREMRRGVA